MIDALEIEAEILHPMPAINLGMHSLLSGSCGFPHALSALRTACTTPRMLLKFATY